MLLQQFLRGWLQQYVRGHAKATVHTPCPLCLQLDSLHLLREQGWLQPRRGCRGPARHAWQGGWVSVHEHLLLSHSPVRHSLCIGPGLQQRSPAKGEQGRQGLGQIAPKDTGQVHYWLWVRLLGWKGKAEEERYSSLKCQVPATSQGKEPHVNDQLLSM